MIQVSLDLYLDGEWKNFHVYNQVKFDDRKDGQLRSGMCFIRTETKTRFKPMRKARLNVMENGEIVKQISYFAYFKSQKIDREWWMHEVTLIDPAKRVQGEMINGLRVVQNSDYSITLYSTFQRLCNTTPLRLVSQENVYNCTTDERIVSLMKKIRSPEYAWSCRTLFWECLKEIGMDMGAYFPTVEWDDNGKYIISFIPTEEIVKTVTDFPYSSYAECEDINQVCSEIDTDISNVIATNQGSASVVFPSQNGWITPRTDDIRLTDQNCEIQLPTIINRIIKITIPQKEINLDSSFEYDTLYEMTGDEELDLTFYFVEKKKYETLKSLGVTSYKCGNKELYKNNTCYWIEDTNKIILVSTPFPGGAGVRLDIEAIGNLISSAIFKTYEPSGLDEREKAYITVNGKTFTGSSKVSFSYGYNNVQRLKFRVEYVSQNTSTKLRAVKQEKCDYEYVVPFNQRAEIVDAPALGNEMFKTVNQMGVRYFIAVNKYLSLNDVLPVGTAFVDTDGVYILTSNQFEITNHDHYDVAHSFSKNWAMVSSYLKQNKQYRNTKIPTDILVRNLHYQDYFVISEKTEQGETGLISLDGLGIVSKVFGGTAGETTEVNNFAFYNYTSMLGSGVIISANSFGCKNSIILSAQFKNNLSAGKQLDVDDDYMCTEVLYTLPSGSMTEALMSFGIGISNLNPDSLPYSKPIEAYEYEHENALEKAIVSGVFRLSKSSAEHINMTYQVHFVSDMPDIVIGSLIAENNPLVVDVKQSYKYQLWGLTRQLPKTAIIIDETYGVKVVDIDDSNRKNYWIFGSTQGTDGNGNILNRSISLTLKGGKLNGEYIGWAITDEKGRLYIARNSKPNEEQSLIFNHLHKYHEEK